MIFFADKTKLIRVEMMKVKKLTIETYFKPYHINNFSNTELKKKDTIIPTSTDNHIFLVVLMILFILELNSAQ